jgi:starch phosphorylase
VVELDGLEPKDVRVQVRHGSLDPHGELVGADTLDMQHAKDLHDGAHRFALRFSPARSPRAAWSVRIIPGDPRLITPFISGLIVSDTLHRVEAHAAAHE